MRPTLSFLSPPSICHYLPGRLTQLRYEIDPTLDADAYLAQLQAGWRRFGPIVFRPECPACRMCQSLRVPVSTFQPTASQRRVWKRNAGDVSIRIGEPTISPEKQELYDRFHRHGAEIKGWPADGHLGLDVFAVNPFRTEEWSYYLGARLIAVGYVDALRDGLSAIYFYWDPAERHRSPGTFNILTIIEHARERGLPHVYLGYFVEGYRSLEYKARFGPNEILRPEGEWEAFG